MGNMFGIAQLGWNLVEWFQDAIGDIGATIVSSFYKLLFAIWSSVASVLDCIQIMFQMLVGVIPVKYTSNAIFANSGNFVMDIIMHPFVYESFLRILVLSLFLLIIFTFVAIVKSEFSSESSKGSGNAKGPIIGKSLKAFFSFLFVPICCVFGIIASSFLMQALDRSTSPSESTLMSNKLFACCAYSCNRARIDNDFYLGMIGKEGGYDLSNRVVKEGGYSQGRLADLIDSYFGSGKVIEEANSSMTHFKTGDRFDNYIDKSWFITDNSITKDTYFNCKNQGMVFYFYDLSQFNWVVAIFSIFFLGSILVSITLGAAVRLYELAILFILSPAIISMMPLDDGPFKQWKKRFIAKVVMIFAPVVALNLYFTLVGTLMQVDFMASITNAINSGMNMVIPAALIALIAAGGIGTLIFVNIFNLFICIAGAMVCKESIKWLGDMIGADDMLGAGDKLKKGVSDFVKTNAVVGAGIGAAHILGDMSKDYAKGKLEEHAVKKENKTLGKGQMKADKMRGKDEKAVAKKEHNQKWEKAKGKMSKAESNARNLAKKNSFKKEDVEKSRKIFDDEYNKQIQSGKSETAARDIAEGRLHTEGGLAQARYVRALHEYDSAKEEMASANAEYKQTKKAVKSRHKALKSEVASGNVNGTHYKQATIDANNAITRVMAGEGSRRDKKAMKAVNKSVGKFDKKYSEEAQEKRKDRRERIGKEIAKYSSGRKAVVDANKKAELNEHSADNNRRRYYDGK